MSTFLSFGSPRPHPKIAPQPGQHGELKCCFHNTFWQAPTAQCGDQHLHPNLSTFIPVRFFTPDYAEATAFKTSQSSPWGPIYILQYDNMDVWP